PASKRRHSVRCRFSTGGRSTAAAQHYRNPAAATAAAAAASQAEVDTVGTRGPFRPAHLQRAGRILRGQAGARAEGGRAQTRISGNAGGARRRGAEGKGKRTGRSASVMNQTGEGGSRPLLASPILQHWANTLF